MKSIHTIDFLLWALKHVRPNTIPADGRLLIPGEQCGVDPWEYLYGMNGQLCTQQILSERFDAAYKDFGWDVLTYEVITSDWVERGAHVCDGPGLLNAYRALTPGLRFLMTEHGIFSRLCFDRASVGETHRAFEPGEAVFMANRYGTMKRIGWVCGFDAQDEPLILEARGLCYGVCIAPFRGRGWTHRARLDISLDKEYADAN